MTRHVPNYKMFRISALAHYPLHYVQKMMLACEVLGYRHPDLREGEKWAYLYYKFCHGLHVEPETINGFKLRMTEDRIANETVVS